KPEQTAGDKPEEGEDDVKSSCPLCLRQHTSDCRLQLVCMKPKSLVTAGGVKNLIENMANFAKPENALKRAEELCVDMRKGRFAKDGLIQYRIVCQQVNVSSLEEVMKHFHLSTEKAEQALTQAQALEEALDVDDLEADKRPEA
ncbi:hypothetical protein Gotri_027794, partial [Gossypium trilobum]|nr:hypothetical protein [Gossypium trilobum]